MPLLWEGAVGRRVAERSLFRGELSSDGCVLNDCVSLLAEALGHSKVVDKVNLFTGFCNAFIVDLVLCGG